MSGDHFNTGPGWPQTREEVERLLASEADDPLNAFMSECGAEPADPDNCLACYAYIICQEAPMSIHVDGVPATGPGPGFISVAQIRAAIAQLCPDEMTPTARRLLESICDQHS